MCFSRFSEKNSSLFDNLQPLNILQLSKTIEFLLQNAAF